MARDGVSLRAEADTQTASVSTADAYTETLRLQVDTLDENVGTEMLATVEDEAQTPTVDSVDKDTSTVILLFEVRSPSPRGQAISHTECSFL